MNKDAIERALKRGTGELEGANYEEVRYEGYAPGGIAVLIECTTDNRNRTVSEVRHAFSKCGGNLGTDGSVAYLFNKVGVITFAPGTGEEQVMDAAIDAGAEDIDSDDDGSVEVTTSPEAFHAVRQGLEAAGLQPESAEIVQRAATEVSVTEEDGQRVLKLLDALEELDDVQDVYSNADFPETLLSEAS